MTAAHQLLVAVVIVVAVVRAVQMGPLDDDYPVLGETMTSLNGSWTLISLDGEVLTTGKVSFY